MQERKRRFSSPNFPANRKQEIVNDDGQGKESNRIKLITEVHRLSGMIIALKSIVIMREGFVVFNPFEINALFIIFFDIVKFFSIIYFFHSKELT